MLKTLLAVLLAVLAMALVDDPDPGLVVDLARASWSLNEQPVPEPVQFGEGSQLALELSFDGPGTRWSTTFLTGAPANWRLLLDWQLGPQGLLLELLLDGEPLVPLRDAWRPTERWQSADLGPRWLGKGQHLLEFVSRETGAEGRVAVRRLTLGASPGTR